MQTVGLHHHDGCFGCANCTMQMTHYVQDDHGVTLHFQPAVHAKLLVGADGYFSKVRTQCLDDGPPTFSVSSLELLHQ